MGESSGAGRRSVSPAAAPRRRCAGCGCTATKGELVRFALAADCGRDRARVVIDRAGTLHGRGAYVCKKPGSEDPVRGCLELAIRRNGLARALRAQVTVDPELVESLAGV